MELNVTSYDDAVKYFASKHAAVGYVLHHLHNFVSCKAKLCFLSYYRFYSYSTWLFYCIFIMAIDNPDTHECLGMQLKLYFFKI